VIVLYGSPAGLTTTGVQALIEGAGGVPGPARAYDRFGTSVAIGERHGDGYADLAAGAVQESLSDLKTGGMVVVLRARRAGWGATGSSVVSVSATFPSAPRRRARDRRHQRGRPRRRSRPDPRFNGGALAYLPAPRAGSARRAPGSSRGKPPGCPRVLGNHTDDGISDRSILDRDRRRDR
jgi:hypothetical protein